MTHHKKRGVPERSARKVLQITFRTGKLPGKRADGVRRTAANQHTLPDRISNLCFFDAKYALTGKKISPIFYPIKSNALSIQFE